jgi:hypothetical protein
MDLVLQVVMDARLTIMLCEKFIVTKSEEASTQSNLVKFSREGYGSKRAALPVIIIIIIIIIIIMMI